MPADPSQVLEFDPSEPRAVLDAMAALRAGRDGWINLQPAVPAEEVPPPPSVVAKLMGNKGPEVPFCTWVPGRSRRGAVEPTSIGVQHAAGTRAMGRLRDAGLEVAAGWRVLADNPRRGVVVEVPDDADDAAVLAWLVRAASVLCDLDLPRTWHAAIHRRA